MGRSHHTKKKTGLGDKYRLPCDHENRFSLFWVSFLLADHRDYHRQLCLHRRWSPRSAGFRCQQKHSERHLHICEVFVTTILTHLVEIDRKECEKVKMPKATLTASNCIGLSKHTQLKSIQLYPMEMHRSCSAYRHDNCVDSPFAHALPMEISTWLDWIVLLAD